MTELHDILPKELKNSLDSFDYEEEGGLIVHSIKYFDKELHFDFSLYKGDIEKNETQYWQMQVLNYRDSKIDIHNLGGYFNFYSDHYLLWEYLDNTTDLYFKNSTSNPELLLADIYNIHNTTFNNHIQLERFINGGNLLTLCKSSIGLFAHGPKQILKYYFDCLTKAGKEPYFFGDHQAKNWDGEKWILENKDLKLALIGGTYFIGQSFNFIQLNK